MRVVFDSNIFISAFVITGSTAEKAILKILSGEDTLLISKLIIDEVLSVLARKFSYNIEALSHTALFLSEIAELIIPNVKLEIFQDKSDNKIMECAVSGRADLIVTGDREMLKLKMYQAIKIISLREYLER